MLQAWNKLDGKQGVVGERGGRGDEIKREGDL